MSPVFRLVAAQSGAYQKRVVPGQLRERLGKFLEPAIVRKLAVPDGRVGPKREVEAAVGSGRFKLRKVRGRSRA